MGKRPEIKKDKFRLGTGLQVKYMLRQTSADKYSKGTITIEIRF